MIKKTILTWLAISFLNACSEAPSEAVGTNESPLQTAARSSNDQGITISDLRFYNPLIANLPGAPQDPNSGGGSGGGNSGGGSSGGGNTGGGGSGGGTNPSPPTSRLTSSEFDYQYWYIGSARASTGGFIVRAPISGSAAYFGDIRMDLGTKARSVGQLSLNANFASRAVTGSASGFVWKGANDVPADVVGTIDFTGAISETGTPTNVTGVRGSGSFNGSMTGILDGSSEGVIVSGWFGGSFINTDGVSAIHHKLNGDVSGTINSGSFGGAVTGEFYSNR